MYVCVSTCTRIWACVQSLRGQKRASYPLEFSLILSNYHVCWNGKPGAVEKPQVLLSSVPDVRDLELSFIKCA